MLRKRRDNDEEEDDDPDHHHHREFKRPNIIDNDDVVSDKDADVSDSDDDDDVSDNDENDDDDDVSDGETEDEDDDVSDNDEDNDDEEWFDWEEDDEIIMPTRDNQPDGEFDDLELRFHHGIWEYNEPINRVYADDPPPAPYAGDNEENWALPDIIVAVHRLGEDTSPIGVVRRVYPDGSCKVDVGSNENEDLLTALPNEIKIVPPQVPDKVKIIHGKRRGAIGELFDIRGSDGMIELVDTCRFMKLDMSILAKLGNV